MDKIREIPSKALILFICLYRKILRPYLGYRCKFDPSCSEYALIALKKHNILKAIGLIIGRLFRCQPFSKGGCDPVP